MAGVGWGWRIVEGWDIGFGPRGRLCRGGARLSYWKAEAVEKNGEHPMSPAACAWALPGRGERSMEPSGASSVRRALAGVLG